MLDRYEIEFALYQKVGGDYSPFPFDDEQLEEFKKIKEYLRSNTKLFRLGTEKSDLNFFPALQGPGIAKRHGLICLVKGNLVYKNLAPTYDSYLVTCEGEERTLNARAFFPLAKKDLNEDYALAKIMIGDNYKYMLEIHFHKISQ